LASAIYLKKLYSEVVVLEQAPRLGPVGAGILIPPAGQAVLKEMGLFDRVAAQSAFIKGVRAERSNGTEIIDLRYEEFSSHLRALGTPRHVLFEALRDCALQSGVVISPDSKVTAVKAEPGLTTLSLRDQQITTESLVVVADGSKSTIGRELGLRIWEKHYKQRALWSSGRIDETGRDLLLQRMSGVQRLTGLLPLGAGRASFFWGIGADESLGDWGRFQKEALELIPEARPIIEEIANGGDYAEGSYRSIGHYPWYTGNVVLLGDAAHAMSPHLGQGASLALQDAAALAEALESEPDSSEQAFRIYQSLRLWQSLVYSAISLSVSPFFQSEISALGTLRNFIMPKLQKSSWIKRQMLATMSGLKTGIFTVKSAKMN
jgi:2-polyprenyl-6-methoxyphenol hydroxylase-like FAD-dependent oxidoreductase